MRIAVVIQVRGHAALNQPGATFCDECGAALRGATSEATKAATAAGLRVRAERTDTFDTVDNERKTVHGAVRRHLGLD